MHGHRRTTGPPEIVKSTPTAMKRAVSTGSNSGTLSKTLNCIRKGRTKADCLEEFGNSADRATARALNQITSPRRNLRGGMRGAEI